MVWDVSRKEQKRSKIRFVTDFLSHKFLKGLLQQMRAPGGGGGGGNKGGANVQGSVAVERVWYHQDLSTCTNIKVDEAGNNVCCTVVKRGCLKSTSTDQLTSIDEKSFSFDGKCNLDTSAYSPVDGSLITDSSNPAHISAIENDGGNRACVVYGYGERKPSDLFCSNGYHLTRCGCRWCLPWCSRSCLDASARSFQRKDRSPDSRMGLWSHCCRQSCVPHRRIRHFEPLD